MRFWQSLFDPDGLTAHGFCLSWEPGLIALHAVSDAVIGLSYFSIPLAIASLTHKRRDLQYGWILYAFVGFIVACGATHLLSILTLWVPVYTAEGLVKALAAVLSVATAILLWPLVPRLVALPSPTQLRQANASLSRIIAEHERTLEQLRQSEARVLASNVELERRVAARTAELETRNLELADALAERTAAQRALARSEAEFRASFQGSVVGKAVVEPRTRQILRANQVLADMLGYDPQELVGRTTVDFTCPDDRAADSAEYARLLSGETESHIQEKRYIRRDGTPFWVRVSAALTRVPESEHPVLTIASIEDIDARRTAEAELQAAKQDLEQVVVDRTNALKQRDLLLREVYHRVKNNLQIVDGLITLQALKLKDPDAKEALRGLHDRIYALGLVHQQLMSSSDLRTFDIVPFLHELSNNLSEGWSEDGAGITVDAVAVQVGLDYAVPFGLLVTELVTNSLKYAVPADGTRTVRVGLSIAQDGQIVLTVSDDGLGREANAADAASSGLGSGLINGLVAQLRGAMSVRNDSGRTTEIRTPLPLNE